MPGAKDEVRQILDELGEDVSLEEIQYHIYVRQKIAKAREQVARGETVSQQDAEERMSKWLGRSNGRR